MNKLEVSSESFGELSGFVVGDVVSWSDFDRQAIGIVSDLYFLKNGGRNVAWATVFDFEKQKKCGVLCVNLKIVTKNELQEPKN